MHKEKGLSLWQPFFISHIFEVIIKGEILPL
jgi:hypothetical protein